MHLRRFTISPETRRNVGIDKLHVMPARTQKRVYTEGVYQTQPIVFRPIMIMFACILVMQFYFNGSLVFVIAGGINPVYLTILNCGRGM